MTTNQSSHGILYNKYRPHEVYLMLSFSLYRSMLHTRKLPTITIELQVLKVLSVLYSVFLSLSMGRLAEILLHDCSPQDSASICILLADTTRDFVAAIATQSDLFASDVECIHGLPSAIASKLTRNPFLRRNV